MGYGRMVDAVGWEENGVYAAVLVSESLLALLCVAIFRRGNWKQVQV